MWPRTRLTELLGLSCPIVQAPMAGSDSPELAAAVANAGGLGSLGCGRSDPGAIAGLVARMRAATNGAFNLNFFAHPAPRVDEARMQAALARLAPYYGELGVDPPEPPPPPHEPGFTDDALAALLAAPPPVVSFHFGLPGGDAVARLREAGCRVIASATTTAEARALEAGGVDAIIAQGWEAGGHRGAVATEDAGTGVGLMALLPQVVDAVSVPVIAAGGIADGRGITAALVLGAEGVQIGTAFLSCPESAIGEPHRRALREAADADTVLSLAYSGRPCRLRRSRYVAEMAGDQSALPDFPLVNGLTAPLRAADASTDGDFQFLLYGQAAALNRAMPAAELVSRLGEETAAALVATAGRA
jgi:nitronate monooxygenase